jgi:isopentenyl-diphosphate delta-isomerase
MTEHEVVDVYVARASRSITIHPNPAEVMAVRWETFADLDAEMARAPQTFTPWFRHYLADHRARIFGAFGA